MLIEAYRKSIAQNIKSFLPKAILSSQNKIVCVGAGSTANIFDAMCLSENKSLGDRVQYYIDDNIGQTHGLSKQIKLICKDNDDSVCYLILTIYADAKIQLKNRLLELGITKKNIFTLDDSCFLTKAFISDDLIADNFVAIECGARGDTPQINSLVEHLGDKILVHAFEADEEECERLSDQKDAGYVVHPFIIDEETGIDRTMHVIYPNGHCVFHRSNIEMQSRYCASLAHDRQGDYGVFTSKKTKSLDGLIEESAIPCVDYLYINIDSAEYYALKGAKKTLAKNINIVEVETYFNDWYKDQPLFGDVNKIMTEYGFELLTLRMPNNILPTFSPFLFPGEKLLHMNAIYIKKTADMGVAELLKMACILEVLGFVGSAFEMVSTAMYLLNKDNHHELLAKVERSMAEVYSKYLNFASAQYSFEDYVKKAISGKFTF